MTTMTWDEFREQAAARAGMHALGGDMTTRLAYLALGLCGEAGEYAQAVPSGSDSAVPELGDVAWYLAMIEHATGLRAAWPTGAPDGASPMHDDLIVQACAVAECVKRPMQGRDLPVDRLRSALDGLAAAVYVAARFWSGSADGMLAVYAANIAKTTARFGAKFTVEKARALDAEAKADAVATLTRERDINRAAWLNTRKEMNELLDAEKARADARLAACETACAEAAKFNAKAMTDDPERADYWCARRAEASQLREKINAIRFPRVIGVAIEESAPLPDLAPAAGVDHIEERAKLAEAALRVVALWLGGPYHNPQPDAVEELARAKGRELDALRAMIAGRETAPTLAEINAHADAGGSWLADDGIIRHAIGAHEACAARLSGDVTRWWAFDANRRPCAWPEAKP